MSSYKRFYFTGACYFFTVVTKDRTPLFRETFNANLLIKIIHKVKIKYPFKMIAWVLMHDHFHCIWQMPEDDCNYSTRWTLIKSNFTKAMNKFAPHRMQYWQDRYWEHTIRNETDFDRHIDYIHFNPVKHGYVKRIIDWPFSSFHGYVEKGFYPKDWGSVEISFSKDDGNWGE